MVPGIKGLGQEDGDDVHVIFTLSSMPEEPTSPQLIIPDQSQCVLDLGKKWRIELPVDATCMKFRNDDVGGDACGVIVQSDTCFLRVLFYRSVPRAAFMDLSTGKFVLKLPDAKNVLFSGWAFRLKGADDMLFRWPE